MRGEFEVGPRPACGGLVGDLWLVRLVCYVCYLSSTPCGSCVEHSSRADRVGLRRPAAFYGLSAAPIRDSRNQRCLHITFRYQSFTDRAKKLISTPPQATITSLLPLPLQQPGVQLSADSAVSALEATKLILARAESLEASREAVPDDAKKAASLDGLN